MHSTQRHSAKLPAKSRVRRACDGWREVPMGTPEGPQAASGGLVGWLWLTMPVRSENEGNGEGGKITFAGNEPRRSAPQRRDHLCTRESGSPALGLVFLLGEGKRDRKWAGNGGFAYPIRHGALPGLQTRRSKSVAGMKQAASATSTMRSVAREEIMESCQESNDSRREIGDGGGTHPTLERRGVHVIDG